MNKVATAARLYFDVQGSPSLDDDVKKHLLKLSGKRATDEGVILIDARRYRTQEQNRADAVQRLVVLIQKALEKPAIRKATRPSSTARAVRVGNKRKRGEIKRTRRLNQADLE